MINVQSGKDVDDATTMVENYDKKLPYAENSVYYGIIATDVPKKDFEALASLTSSYLLTYGEQYMKYEENAYNPFSEDPNKAFDGWVIHVDNVGKTITYRPSFVPKMKPVNNIVTHSISSSFVTFIWSDEQDAYGYRVEVKINGEIATINEIQKEQSTISIGGQNMIEYKVNGLTKGDLVEIKVYVLAKDANGNYRSTSKVFTATSLIDKESTIYSKKLDLDSEGVSTEYLHTMESDIGDVTAAGDYYYLAEDDQGKKTYVFFTNTTYSFGDKKITRELNGTRFTLYSTYNISDVATIPYGTVFNSANDVLSFLRGYQKYLTDIEGWKFNNVNGNGNLIDFELSLETFMGWATTFEEEQIENPLLIINPASLSISLIHFGSILNMNEKLSGEPNITDIRFNEIKSKRINKKIMKIQKK
mgnify:CR=1 FL=1